MSGHSKWNNIQGRKNAQDSKRSKVIPKISERNFCCSKKKVLIRV